MFSIDTTIIISFGILEMYMDSEKDCEIIDSYPIVNDEHIDQSAASLQRRLTNEIKKSKFPVTSTNNGRKCLKIDKDGSSYLIPLERLN